jgi:hypothetical protein
LVLKVGCRGLVNWIQIIVMLSEAKHPATSTRDSIRPISTRCVGFGVQMPCPTLEVAGFFAVLRMT